MACGGEMVDVDEELIDIMENMSIDEEERCTPLCWTDSQIEVVQKEKSTLISLSKVAPPLFQFLVQRQQAVLEKLAKDHGFYIHFQRSKNYLVAESVADVTEQNMDRIIEKFIQSIGNVCDKYDIKSFSIEDSIWPYVEKDFNEKAKILLEKSILQVYKKCEGTYSLIGLAENFGKYESLLSTLSRQYKTIKIENKELFDVLEMEKILGSRFKKVKVLVHDYLLLLNGEEKAVEECAKCYKELSKIENMHSALRVVSENVYEILRKKNIKKKINSFLVKRGFHVYWTVAKLSESCCLDCKCISGTPEREADYLTSYLVKEIEIEDKNLQTGQIDKWIEEIKNATLFISESGLKTVVYYGNMDLWKNAEANRDQSRFWFNQTIASSELLTLLAKFEVQNFINSKLQIRSERWSIIEDKRKIRVKCQCIAEVDHLVSFILDQVWCVSRPAEVCQNDGVKQFLKDHSKFVEIKQDEKYCTFYVIVDLKDELEKLLEAQSERKIDEDQNDSKVCNEMPTERVNLFIEPDIRKYLSKRCNAKLTKISEEFNVCVSHKGTSLELKGKSKENILQAKQTLLGLLKGIVHQKDVVRIRRDMSYEKLKKEIEKLEDKSTCTLTLSKKKDEEPEYLQCWDAKIFRIITSEGSLECTRCDVLICFVDENCQPVGRSAQKIFMTGGWTELEDAVTNSKEVQKSWILKSSKCKVTSSSATGFLKCRQLLFVSSENLQRDIEDIWNKVLGDVSENKWRSICFPVESSQIIDGTLCGLLSFQATEGYKRLESSLEIQFCLWDTDKLLKEKIHNICNQQLSPKFSLINFNVDGEGLQDTKKGLHSSIEVNIEKGSFLEVAEAKKVDVIVNSTNLKLDLEKGFVSNAIFVKGGQGIKDELTTSYPHGIMFGDIAITSGHELTFKKIFHGALYKKWVSTGNFSLKVLKCFIKRCLLAMERDGFCTIAFPALGTGGLGYPYIPVAKTIMECVTEFGKQHPETCIQTVYIVVHEGHSVQVFEDLFENTDSTAGSDIADVFSKPTISFLEHRIAERGILIQILPEKIDELVDAIIEFTNDKSTNGQVDFGWCSSMGCYYALMSVNDMDHLQNLVDQYYKMLDAKRITSARICIKDNVKDSKMCTAVIEAFMKKLKPNLDREACGLSLRKLQFLLCKEQYEKKHKIFETKSSWFSSFFNKDVWRKKTVKQQRDVLISVLGPMSDHVKRALNEFRELAAMENVTGKWCFYRDTKWIFVSTASNSKLNQAVEQGLSVVKIKEDGITYDYNFDESKRYPGLEKGEKVPNNIMCLPDFEDSIPITGTKPWYVLDGDKWVLLPENICRMLTDAKNSNKQEVFDGPYVYDLISDERKHKGKEKFKDKIIYIEVDDDGNMASGGTNTKTKQFSTKGLNQTDKEKERDIFEFVTGQITYQDTGNEKLENKIKRTLESVGCKEITRKDCTFFFKGSLWQIVKVNELMLTPEQETGSTDTSPFTSIVTIAMSNQEFEVFKHFGTECQWFKTYGNKLDFNENGLICELSMGDEEKVKKEMKKHLKKIRTMSSDYTEVIENQDCNIAAITQDIQVKFPTVCLVINKKVIELTSDSYEDLLKVKNLLKQQMSGIKNRRANRTFEKTEDGQGGTESLSDVYRGDVYAEKRSKYTAQQQTKLEIKTKEGLKIKIYSESITRLTVDCIVNAANENLMHGGGVAAAISEAAGYQFDQESRDYVKKYGPISVGTCCVTSAGKLPYKCVIHTVGPRWGDYQDKYQCLRDLQESVEVTFIEADERGMKSLAIPAISSGIFAVPRNNCVEEYYKAAMSFSRNYPFKSLQEIHFVDRDESMVRAIQEVFQSKEASKSTLEKSENPGKAKDLPTGGAEYSAHSVMPDSTPYTIVHVSENFQVKIHLGKVTDVAADAVVCPQDEYLSSKDDIAVEIFKKVSCKPKSSNKKMNHGEISSQSLHGNFPWKLIIHAVTPRYDCDYSKDSMKFGAVLKTLIQNIIEAADGANIGSVAIPLIGAGKDDFNTPVEICASNFFKAVMESKSKVLSLKDIYLVLDDEDTEKMYLESFKHACKTTSRAKSNVENSKTLTGLPTKEVENCCICMDEVTDPKRLKKCGHIFCKECIEQYFKYKPACPSCGQIYGKMTGDQPPGSIMIRNDFQQRLEGFSDSAGCIILTYTFQSGRQGSEHPEQGKWYQGISRSGYVPNNEKGRLVAKLLNVAFSRRLVFTIGRSRTTGHDGVITWNDIHHKTRIYGGPARFGYPDPTYLDRVLEELEAKGVTEESADDPEEYKEYSRQFGNR